ncbi:sigma-70 family RNA polymerase sigma factor [Dactylosporangium sp. NPDC051541]|uniref:sigma-70 family RNA polymerase sigma factor n=1 Tax=Dactylosporangium sp. NPDC051541 TaxID=3363977 RepID=UPI00379F2707
MTFEEFVSARLGALVRYATVVCWDPYLAEDVVQNVLLRLQSRWGHIGGLEAPERYVRRMVVNEFLSWRRRPSSRQVSRPTEVLDPLMAPEPDPSGRFDERDTMIRLIGALPRRQRAVVALRFYEELEIAEIAELMQCRPVTVRTHLMRAMAALRVALPSRRALELEERA